MDDHRNSSSPGTAVITVNDGVVPLERVTILAAGDGSYYIRIGGITLSATREWWNALVYRVADAFDPADAAFARHQKVLDQIKVKAGTETEKCA